MPATSISAPETSVSQASTWLWCLLLLVWFCLAVAGTNYAGDSLDMDETLNNPVRMLRGELPYRDFWLLQSPGEVLLPAALYGIGFDVDGLLRAMGVISVAIGMLAFAIARALFGTNPAAALTACMVFFSGPTYRHQGFLYIHAYLLAVLLGLFFLHRYWDRNRERDLFLAGVGLGLGLCFRFYYSGAAIAACCLVLLWRGHSLEMKPRVLLKTFGIFAAGLLVFPVLASLVLRDVWGAMAQSVVIDSVVHGTVRSLNFWREFVDNAGEIAAEMSRILAGGDSRSLKEFSREIGDLMIRTLPLVLAACGALWFRLSKPRGRPMSASAATLIVLVLWGVLVFTRGYTRGAVPKLSHAATPWFFVSVFLFYEFRRLAPSIWTRIASITLSVMILGFAQGWVSITGASTAELVSPSERVTAPYGTLEIGDSRRAEITRELIRQVVEHTEEDDFIFVTPKKAPPLYALTRRRNPTYYDSLVDLVYRPSVERQQAVCNDLADNPPVLIIHMTKWNFQDDPNLRFETNCPILNSCIAKGYEQVSEVGPYQILRPASTITSP